MLTGTPDGASLIYTSPSMSSPLQTLVHASLGIHSLLKRQPLKENVIERDKVVVPPNWDSWSKIRVLRDGFDVETVSTGWSIDLDQPFPSAKVTGVSGINNEVDNGPNDRIAEVEGSAVAYYEEQVRDTSLDALQLAQGNRDTSQLEVASVDTQAFLANQVERLEQQKKTDEKAGKENSFAHGASDDMISDHIGPVQFNMGGIQVDADDMVQRLKVSSSATICRLLETNTESQDRHGYGQSPEPSLDEETDIEGAQAPVDTDTLAKFFGDLMNRKPTAGGKAAKT